MGRSSRSAVRNYHDRVAGRYDLSYDDAFWRWHDALTWDYLKPFLPRVAGAHVVDLGCGTGKWGARVLKSGYSVTSVDISPNMLERARRKLTPNVPAERVDFVQADLCDLRMLPKKSFALAMAMGDPIGCCRSPAKAMKEIRRLLADDGVLVATFDNRLAAIEFYLKKGDPSKLSRFLRDGKTHWLTKDPDEQFEIHTFTPADVVSLVRGAGYELLEMVGKTVLPMRHYRDQLGTPEARRTWARVEKGLCRDQAAIGRASHIQVACRVVRG